MKLLVQATPSAVTHAIIARTGQEINHNPAIIAGSASHNIPITVTSQAIAPPTNIIFFTSSGFSVAHLTIELITGCMLASN